MGGACVTGYRTEKCSHKFCPKTVKGRDKLSTSADRRLILKYVIKITRGRAWSGLI
jgi:hypothetical protein